jgi:succinoglycan biosynthesis transport protein ExoP
MQSLIPGGNGSSPKDDGAPTRGPFRAPVRAAPPRLPRASRFAGAESNDAAGDALDIGRYLDILRERWRTVAVVVVAITGAVAIGDAVKEPVFRATGTIEIRKQAAEVVPVEAQSQLERISDQYLQTQYAMLRSPAVIRRTLSDTTLLARLEASLGVRPADRGAGRRIDAMLSLVRERLTVDPILGSRIVRVSFEANDSAIAAAVVNALFAQYITMREESGAGALQRLAEQADSVRSGIVRAELQIQQFVNYNRLGSVVGGPGELESVPRERLRRLQQELTLAETEGFRAEAQYSASREQTAAIDSDLLKTLRARIAEIQGEYSRLRSAFTDSFPRARQLRGELAQLDSLVLREQQRVSLAMNSQHRATLRRRELLRAAVNEQRFSMDSLSAKQAEYERLKRDLDGQKQLYAMLQQKRKESAVAAALSVADVAVLDPATPPTAPVRPLPTRDVPLAAMVGLMLGVGLAFVRAHSDGTVRTLDEVEVLSDVRVVGLIPSVRVVRGGAALSSPAAELAAGGKRYSLDCLAEAFRGLRTSMLFESTSTVPRTLLVTSAAPGDGKTFVSTNLALSLAALRRKVLLIDADLRRPAVHHAFRLTSEAGLTSYLTGRMAWQDLLSRDVVPGLDVLASPTAIRNASDLLSSAALRTLLSEAKAAYDFVLIDAPALFINVPDARILAQMVDGVTLVVRSGATPRDLVRRLLAQTPNVVGVVINGYDLRQLPASYADYGETAATQERRVMTDARFS